MTHMNSKSEITFYSVGVVAIHTAACINNLPRIVHDTRKFRLLRKVGAVSLSSLVTLSTCVHAVSTELLFIFASLHARFPFYTSTCNLTTDFPLPLLHHSLQLPLNINNIFILLLPKRARAIDVSTASSRRIIRAQFLFVHLGK